ncbi:MAG TPA: arsenate reductase ArsC [Verrucomicrobiae bacterium]|nr:arsenate reductase ArsC [Verrucomicrobiae bacterium]
MPRETVLFACVQNAGRSQMAAALFNTLADPSAARALSAGSEPAERVHPAVVQVMRELGIELGETPPRPLTPDLVARADVLITMGCGAACPVVPGVPHEDWPLPDPKDEPVERVREIRDQIRARVEALIAGSGWR